MYQSENGTLCELRYLITLLATATFRNGQKLLYWGVLVVGGICPVLPFMLADSTYINRLITFTFPSVPFCLQRLCLQSVFLQKRL